MAQPKQATKWLEYPQMELSKFAAPQLLRDDYVVIASSNHDEGLYSYHLSSNKWFLIWKYPLNVEPLRHTLLIDKNAAKIYLYNTIPSACDCFYEIDLNSKSHQQYKGTVHGLPEGLGKESGGCALLETLNGYIHAVGGYTNGYHSLWHRSNDTVDTFKQYPIGNRAKKTSLYGHALIKIESKNQLAILGGNSSMMFGGYLKDIWFCNTQNNMQWIKSDITMPHKMYWFGYISIYNERYGNKVVTFGGKTNNGLINTIWILNLDTMEWVKSEIKCPKKAMYYAVKTQYNDIHLFEMNKSGHWKMRLSDIIPGDINRKRIRKSSKSPKSSSRAQSQIDLNIITSLKANLIQEKKASRILMRENEKYNQQQMENEQKLTDTKSHNMTLLTQNEILNEKLNALHKAYDELNENYIEKQHELLKMNENYNELREKYAILLEKEKRKTLNDTSNYKNWTYQDIVYWIGYLECGRFQQYQQILLQRLKKENIKGIHLTDLDKHDIHRLGCTDYSDKKALLNHLQSLGK